MKINWILAALTSLIMLNSDGHMNTAADLAAKLTEYSAQYPTEKVFIHHDRDYYGPGETIWFKSYLVAGSFNQPSPISNNVHVELISSDKELIQHVLLYSEEGFADGHLNLPEDLASGTYLLRSYTNWMKNFDEDYFFEKEIEIVAGGNAQTIQQDRPEGSLQFFAEGGELVAGIPTRIAFQATNLNDDGFELIDENGNILQNIKTLHNEMGLFALTPEHGKTYAFKSPSGKIFDLPKVEKTGFSIAVNPNLEDIVKLTLRSNDETKGKSDLKILVHSRGLVNFALDVDLSKNVAFLNLPKAQLPEGISHITLFDEKDRPLIERLVFINKNPLTAEVSTDNSIYGTRSLVKTKVRVTNKSGDPVEGSFSMAALDMNLVPSAQPSKDIRTELLLESDLRGKINNPGYYFSNDPAAADHLDLLMMTKGWRRFLWDEVINAEYPEVDHLIEKGFNVEGKIVDKFNGKPISKGRITYFDNSLNPPLIDEVVADENGSFSINNIILYNNRPVTFQGTNRKGRGQAIIGFQINEEINFEAPTLWSAPIIYGKEEEELRAFANKSQERQQIDDAFDFDTTATRLDDVVVIGERARISQEESAYGAGEVTFTYDQINTATKAGRSPIEILQGRVSGVSIVGSGLSVSVTIRGGIGGFSANAPPFYLLDDVPTDLQTILNLSSMDIERVEVFKGPSAAIFGANGSTGVLAFYTYKGGGVQRPTEGMITKIVANAYQGPMDFYAPSYEEELPEHVKPDRRVLVHWEPMISTDENGEAELEFWTTDNATTIQLDLQGISKSGQTVTQLKTIEVEKEN